MSSPWFEKQAAAQLVEVPIPNLSPIEAAAYLVKRGGVIPKAQAPVTPPTASISKQIDAKGGVAVPPIKLTGPPKKVAIPPTLGKKTAGWYDKQAGSPLPPLNPETPKPAMPRNEQGTPKSDFWEDGKRFLAKIGPPTTQAPTTQAPSTPAKTQP